MRNRLSDEQGFTLIELLVVILIIGILAAIALPNFLGQRTRGQDASAKSNARNAVSMVEACNTDTQDYQQCQSIAATVANLGSNTGLTFVAGAPAAENEVQVLSTNAKGYVITAYSKSTNTFSITKDPATGAISRDCTRPETSGGCKADLKW